MGFIMRRQHHHQLLQLLCLLLLGVGLVHGFQSPLFAPQSRIIASAVGTAATRPPQQLALSTDPSPSQSVDSNSKSLLQTIDRAGLSLKPKAYRASELATRASSRSRRLLFLLQTSLFYTLFIFYRAYRGFFVILPAVFRRVYQKLETAVGDSPLDDDTGAIATKSSSSQMNRWRTRITVSVLASVVTLSYVLQGAVRVAMKFMKYLTKTSDVSGSFAAAAMEQETNERNLVRMARPDDMVNGLPPPPLMTTEDDDDDDEYDQLKP